MKVKPLIFIILFAGILFAGCEKTETVKTNCVPEKPTDEMLQQALHKLADQGVDLSTPLSNLKSTNAELLEASSSFSEMYFTLYAKLNTYWCLSQGKTWTVDYWLYNANTGTWTYWGNKPNYTCLSDASTQGTYSPGQDTYVIFLAQVYLAEPTGTTYLGYALSNWLFLDNPW